jgi:hypothetical protein
MTIRTYYATLVLACAVLTATAQDITQSSEPISAVSIDSPTVQSATAGAHGPSLVAYCQCYGLVSSTGNLYFTTFAINEFGPSYASFYRTGKYSLPGTEGLLYTETGPLYFDFGNVVWALVSGNYYGYFVANYDRPGQRVSQIKRVPLGGGAPVTLFQSPAYIGVGDLATDGSTLFWVDEGGVRSAPIGGGLIRTMVASAGITHMAIDSGFVYYSIGNVIARMAKTGGPATAMATASAPVTALYVWTPVPSYPVIFWGEHGGAVRSFSPQGLFTWQNPLAGRDVTSVGYDGSRALWIDCAEPGNPQCNVRVQSGGVTPTVVNAGVGASHLQWDATSVYWTGVPGIQRYVY